MMIAYHLCAKSDIGLPRVHDALCMRACTVQDEDVVFVARGGSFDAVHYWRCVSCVTREQIDSAVNKGVPKHGAPAIVSCEDFEGFDQLTAKHQKLVHDKLDVLFQFDGVLGKRGRSEMTRTETAFDKATRIISNCLQSFTEDVRKSLLLEVAKKDDEISKLTAELKAANDRWSKIEACFLVVKNNVR